MAKIYALVGFGISEESSTRPGIWEQTITERPYYGDLINPISRWNNSSDSTNDDIKFSGKLSIVADPFANEHYHAIKYIRFKNEDVKWKVTSVEPLRPRLELDLGGQYNG